MPAFPPRPDARIAAFPGEEVEVVMEGFAADEAAQLFSTHEGYDGSRYQAESNGEIRFTVRLDGSGGERAHYFVMVQEQPAVAEPRLAAFILANIGEDAVEGAQEVIREAVSGPEGTETGP